MPDDENSTRDSDAHHPVLWGEKKEGSSLPVNHKMAAMTICLLPPTVQENVHTLNLSVLVPPEGAFEGIKMVPQQVNP